MKCVVPKSFPLCQVLLGNLSRMLLPTEIELWVLQASLDGVFFLREKMSCKRHIYHHYRHKRNVVCCRFQSSCKKRPVVQKQSDINPPFAMIISFASWENTQSLLHLLLFKNRIRGKGSNLIETIVFYEKRRFSKRIVKKRGNDSRFFFEMERRKATHIWIFS